MYRRFAHDSPFPAGLALILAAVLCCTGAPAEGLAEGLSGLGETDITYLAFDAIPDLVYAADPDSLLEWVNLWESAGGPREAVTRVLVLGAIWDGQFGEDLYGYPIVDDLLWFGDPRRTQGPGPQVSPGLVPDGVDPADAYAAASASFDAFTAAFADQLLPHVPTGSLQEFFCLFYSGRQDEAWDLLDGDGLLDTDLRFYRDQRVASLRRRAANVSAGLVFGGWFPFGQYAFAGDHALVGLQFGLRGRAWFGNAVIEVRTGRTRLPYLAVQRDLQGVSDRFDALLAGFEAGRTVWRRERLEGRLLAGLGLDAIRPFADLDVTLQALHLSLGAGLRLDLGRGRRWYAALDYRREWIRPRNEAGTRIHGDAWSVRAGLGLNFGQAERDALQRLGG